MATYFHGVNPDMETDGLHTLYLMNPNYITAYNSASSSDHHQQQQQQQAVANTQQQQQQQEQQQQNMILLNSVAMPHAHESHSHVTHAPPSLQSQFITLPFAHPISADDSSRSGNSFHYNSWNSGGSSSGGVNHVEVSGDVAVAATHDPYQIHMDNSSNNDDIFRRPVSVSPTTNQQGLSLSLSSQPGHGIVGGSTSSAVQVTLAGVDQHDSNNRIKNFITGSKYLKAAQELLDEVVNVGKVTTTETVKKEKEKVVHLLDNINNEENEAGGIGSGGSGSSRAAAAELSVTQRQEIQMKKTKLISMLDEVEQRYRQYHHQMKTVVTSFEQVAGFGSARPYTSLALRTISKQFRCLKDAITSQIKEASKSLGEEIGEDYCLGVKVSEGSRLRMIDHQIRQQRALQQLGMIQHNAWRPQRGLPERAVSVLRAWLFEHFLHPYPKDSDKHVLAKQTGLTRNQVSNWFINARVRLWKPMVEEMYLEEVKDHPELQGSNQVTSNNNAGSSSTVGKSNDLNYKQQQQQQPSTTTLPAVGTKAQNTSPNDISNNSTISTSPNAAAASSSFQAPPRQGFSLIGPSSDMDGLLQYKKPRGSVPETQISPSSIISAGEISFSRHDHQNNNLAAKFGASLVGYNISQDDMNNNNNNVGGFGAYHHHHQLAGELGRFNANHHHQVAQSFHHQKITNGNVSLTLGLPPGDINNGVSQSYFSSQNMHGRFDRRIEMVGIGGVDQADHDHSNNMGFQNMDIQNRKRYAAAAAAAAPLLPDFVA